MKVTVFGGTGYVGSYLIDELLDKGHHPVLLVRPGGRHKVRHRERCTLIEATSPVRIRYGQPCQVRMPSYTTSAFCVSSRPAA